MPLSYMYLLLDTVINHLPLLEERSLWFEFCDWKRVVNIQILFSYERVRMNNDSHGSCARYLDSI